MFPSSNYLNLNTSYKQKYIKNNSELKYLNEISFETFSDCVCEDAQIMLTNLFISPSRRGYIYWRDALILFLESDKETICVCKEIYPVIAQKYNTTFDGVERAMRACFENVLYMSTKCQRNFVIDKLKQFLVFPKNGELLSRMSEFIVSRDFQEKKKQQV